MLQTFLPNIIDGDNIFIILKDTVTLRSVVTT